MISREEAVRAEARAEAYTDAAAKAIAVVVSPLVVAAFLAVHLPLFVYTGFVASLYWDWFVSPAFGLAVPSLWTLTGLALLCRLLFAKTDPRGMTPDEAKVKYGFLRVYFSTAAGISCFWLMGYVVHLIGD